MKDSLPWRAEQRFDFFVRTREISAQEEAEWRRQRQVQLVGQPYHQAALSALRGLTGREAGTTAAAWRAALKS